MAGAAVSDGLRNPGATLLAALAGEVREPLRGLNGWVAILDARGEDPAVVRQAVHGLEQIARHQAELADDLLEVSRLTAGPTAMRRARTDAVAMARDCVERHREAARRDGVELRFDDPGAPIRLAADEARLRQALDKVLRAAIRRTPGGRSVGVRLLLNGSSGEIVVQDGADGEPPEIPALSDGGDAAPRPRRGGGGLGLGLVLARQLVEGQGGVVEVTSNPQGGGATFSIHLPLWREGGALLAHAQPPPDRLLEDVRLLVVDDDPVVLEALSQALVACGARVAIAASMLSALERLEREAFDGLCSDLDMPGGSGLELARAVRAREASGRRRLPMVAVTGQVGDDSEQAARLAGFDAFLAKPVAVATLARCLRMLVQREK